MINIQFIQIRFQIGKISLFSKIRCIKSCCISAFVALIDKSNSTFTFASKDLGFEKIFSYLFYAFFIYPAIK